jgi:Phage Tail Collar Domain
MPADTRTNRLGALQMATGNDNNNWGDNFNSDILAVLERAICGVATHPVSGGTLDFSANAPPAGINLLLDYYQIFTGTLTNDLTVIVPNVAKTYRFHNKTTSSGGPWAILIKTPAMAQAPCSIPEGTIKEVICDGANNLFRSDHAEIGIVEDHPSGPIPGYIECAGNILSRIRYPELFAKIGTTWGNGNGEGGTFTLPNLFDTGRFRRSRSNGFGVATYQQNVVVSHSHAVSASGSGTTDAAGSHSHGGTTDATNTDHVHGISGNTGVESATHAHGVSGNTGGADTDHIHGATIGNPSADLTHAHTVDIGIVPTQISVALGTSAIFSAQGGSNVKTTSSANLNHTHGAVIGGMSANHAHAFNVTSGGQNANHTHAINLNSGGMSTNTTHAHNFNTAAAGSHTHTFSFGISGNTGATGGSETRPEAAVFIACIRY